MLQTLHNEVFIQIFTEFWAEGTYQRDYDTLRNLCLVSKDVLPLSRAVLYSEASMFYRLTPSSRGEPEAARDDYQLLLRTLRNCAEAAACVRKLDIIVELQVELPDTARPLIQEPIEAACELLGLCGNARTLHLDTAEEATAALTSRGLGGQLEEVRLVCHSHIAFYFLVGVSGLRRLHLMGNIAVRKSVSDSEQLPLPFQLTWLRVEGHLSLPSMLYSLLSSSSGSLRHLSLTLLDLEHHLPPLPGLHSLEIDLDNISPRQRTIYHDFIKSATSLRSLTIVDHSGDNSLDSVDSLSPNLPSVDLSGMNTSLSAQDIVDFVSARRGLRRLDLGWRAMSKEDAARVERASETVGVRLEMRVREPYRFISDEDSD